jgi:hypothetical protein
MSGRYKQTLFNVNNAEAGCPECGKIIRCERDDDADFILQIHTDEKGETCPGKGTAPKLVYVTACIMQTYQEQYHYFESEPKQEWRDVLYLMDKDT